MLYGTFKSKGKMFWISLRLRANNSFCQSSVVWPLCEEGPTRWASSALGLDPLWLLDTLAGQAIFTGACLPHKSQTKDPKISPIQPPGMFFHGCSHKSVKNAAYLCIQCPVSRGQPMTGAHISKPPDVRRILTSLSWGDFWITVNISKAQIFINPKYFCPPKIRL